MITSFGIACSGVERTRKEAVAHAEWDASSFGSNASMESAGTNSHRLKHGHAANEQAAIAAAQVMTLHWEVGFLIQLGYQLSTSLTCCARM